MPECHTKHEARAYGQSRPALAQRAKARLVAVTPQWALSWSSLMGKALITLLGTGLRQVLDHLMRSQPAGARLHPWEPVWPRRSGTRSSRDTFTYEAAIDQFSVQTNRRYRKHRVGRNETYCNIFVWDVTCAMNAEIPHWLAENREPARAGRGREVTANDAIEWLRTDGTRFGWRAVNAADARQHANRGCPAIAAWSNPGGIGHIAVVRPGPATADGPLVAQAGETNSRAIATAHAFRTAWPSGDVRFFAHD